MRVYLWPAEVEKIAQFAAESAQTQQEIEFGEARTARRSTEEITRDTIIGKMGEAAVSKVLQDRYNIDAPIDYTVYPRGRWDGNDLTICGKEIDVKATKAGSKYFLLETNKVLFRAKEGRIPYAFILCTVAWKDNGPTGYVDIVGYIRACDLRYLPRLHRGEHLPGTGITLQADNIACEVDRMDNDLDTLIARLLKDRGAA